LQEHAEAALRKQQTRRELGRIIEHAPGLGALIRPQPDEPDAIKPVKLRPPPAPYVVLPIQLPIATGALYASRVPGRRREQTRSDLEALTKFGIQRVVCLVEREQLVQTHGADLYLSLAADAFGPGFHHLDVRDHDIPEDDDAFAQCVRRVYQALRDDERVLVHCVAGCGRTGMFVACLLSHMGMEPLEGVRLFRRCRRCGPDTTEQIAYAIRYAQRLPGAL